MFKKIMADNGIKSRLNSVLSRIEESYTKRPAELQTKKTYLVAVSKTKPASDIIEAYSAGQRYFGENYVKELVEKGSSPVIQEQCPDIKWHFIGHLQNNKVSKVLKIPGLHIIETIDSEKLASTINSGWEKLKKSNPLKVMVQVNTSEEEEKHGVSVDEAVQLFGYIKQECKNLDVVGVMTIGKYAYDYSLGPNPDFIALMQTYETIRTTYNIPADQIEVSMGMSNDFEQAIASGSTIVRVGSSIFGEREKKF